MICPECNWNQLYIGIIMNSILGIIIALTIAILFNFVIVPKIERKYERNEFNVHIGVMGLVNAFDDMFKFFYRSFEQHMGNIRELNKGEWLPSLHLGWVEIDGGHELINKPEPEYYSALNELSKFDQLNNDLFSKDEERLRNYQKTLFDYLEKNAEYLDPVLKRYIEHYINRTVFYVVWLRKKWNYPEQLFERFQYAKQIIQLLKKEQSFSDKFTRFRKREKFEDIPEIGKFAKKWREYEESEK